jgi:S-adenosylmethionine:tRNA ribosyltransferase-isomerase
MTFDLDDYFYNLPPELIAQEPPGERGTSRLMVLRRDGLVLATTVFTDIGRFLPPKSLIVLNNAKVTPARLLGHRENHDGQVELLILNPPLPPAGQPAGLPDPGRSEQITLAQSIDCWCLGKPGRSLKPGTKLIFSDGRLELKAEVIEAESGSGRRLVRFLFPGPPLSVLESLGHMPLPPYIKRPDRSYDFDRYQTVYAQNPGSVAAPTAGLHFTREHLERIKLEHRIVEISLRVGAGTFAPLTKEALSRGRLHEEYVEVGEATVEAIREARGQKRKIVALGTTTARALEWAAEFGPIESRQGFCSLFIRPGYHFKVVETLITNFHLPSSSLLLLVAAFMSQSTLMKAYNQAIEEKFRFYSYGDAMLIL